MAQISAVMTIASAFLGDAFQMGSIAAKRLLPGGPGQEPTSTTPAGTCTRPLQLPIGLNSSFPVNLRATILVHDFTEENGATAMVPHSQGTLHNPDDESTIDRDAIRQTGRSGDVVVFNGMVPSTGTLGACAASTLRASYRITCRSGVHFEV